MATIGDVEVTITSESIGRSNEVTDRKVEDGTISDNIKKEPDIINLSGVVGKNGWESLKVLLQYQRKGELVKYRGRNQYDNVVIESFDTIHNAPTRDGFTFTCTLKQIIITKVKTVSASVPIEIKPQVKQTTNAGRQTTKPKPSNPEKKKETISKYYQMETYGGTLGR